MSFGCRLVWVGLFGLVGWRWVWFNVGARRMRIVPSWLEIVECPGVDYQDREMNNVVCVVCMVVVCPRK